MPNEVSLMVSAEGLTALADMALAPKNQSKLDDLLSRNAVGTLSADETQEMDLLLGLFGRCQAPTLPGTYLVPFGRCQAPSFLARAESRAAAGNVWLRL